MNKMKRYPNLIIKGARRVTKSSALSPRSCLSLMLIFTMIWSAVIPPIASAAGSNTLPVGTRPLGEAASEPYSWKATSLLASENLSSILTNPTNSLSALQCGYCISPILKSFAHEGGAGSVAVTAPGGCNWTATSNDSFITITSGGSGTGNGTVNYSVQLNTTSSRRTGTLTIAGQTFTVMQGIQFNDVPSDNPFYIVIGRLSGRGVTLGCSANPPLYCPSQPVTREQMAAFIMRARGEFNPPTPATQRFQDVPPSNPFYNFIDRLAALGITLGCSANPPLYCPTQPVTREQMAAFIMRALGEFNPPAPATQRFQDVPPSNPFYNFIDRLAALGITLGCSANPPLYCPSQPVTREQMAAFLIRAFDQPINYPPGVSAGPDRVITLPAMASLSGSGSDDGLPYCSTLSFMWSKVSGPGMVTFANPTSATTTASFSAEGVYILRLTASDSALSSSDDVMVTVNPNNQLPGYQLTVAPSTASAVQRSSATYIVYATSPQPTFSQLVSLSATGLPAGATATFNPPQITAGASATLTVNLANANPGPGSISFTIRGQALVDGQQLIRTVPATLNVIAAGQTTLSGRVLSIESEPIVGAIASLDGRTATTDAAGAFLLSGVTAGVDRPLMIDGRTASAPNRSYPVITEPATIIAGQANVVPFTFYLPPIDVQHEVQVVPGQNTVVPNPRVPGLEMTIPAGANLRNRDGTPVARVSITPLAIDRTPAPLPANVSTAVVYTSQPGGAVANVAMPVVYPNLLGTEPGTRVELYAFNHDTVQWYVYGYGRVSADGRNIIPEIDPSTGRPYGLRDFSWHMPSAAPGGNPGDSDCPPPSDTSNSVNLSTGLKIETALDITFGGTRGSLTLRRIYTSDLARRAVSGRFGRGTKDTYDIRLIGNFLTGGAGRVVIPDEETGRLFSYARTEADGTLVFITTSTIRQLGDVLRKLTDGTFEYRFASGGTLRFNSNRQLTAVVDRNGNTTTLTYTGSNLTRITDPVGRSISLSYQGNLVSSATDPLGRVWRYSYTGNSLTSVTDPLGKVTRYGYDGPGQLTSVTDSRGNTVKQIFYDSNGRVIRQQFADGGIERYNYTLSGNIVTGSTFTDALGRTESMRFNAAGYVIETKDALGQGSQIKREISNNVPTSTTGPCGCAEATREFDERGNVTAVTDRLSRTRRAEYEPLFNNVTRTTDALGRVTVFRYDERGNLTSFTNALNQMTTFGYDGYGELTSITDPLGNTTRIEYDSGGNATAIVDPLNNRVTIEYDAIGRLTAMIDPHNRRSSMTYDAMSRITSTTDPAGAVTRYEYDANGNRTKITDALGRHWATTFDALNRPVKMVDPLGRVVRMTYNGSDELETLTSPSGLKTIYSYDQRGQIATITDPLGGVVRFSYDNRGNLTSLTDQRGNTTTYTYDELYRPVSSRDPLGQVSSVTYDAAGQVIESLDRLGRRISITRDALGRPTRMAYADALVTYDYDAAGRVTRVDDTQSGSVHWSYDNAGRVLSETTPAGAVSYAYNQAGQRTQMRAASRTPVTYSYDTAGRLSTITQGPETFTHGYDQLSRLVSLQRPNGVTTSYSYDDVSRLTRLLHANALGEAIEDYRYQYTPDDEIKQITSLSSATQLPTAKTMSPADAANRLSQVGSASYSFDAQGQTTTKTDSQGETTYVWDARGRLTQARLPNNQTVSYGYDALGRRASRTVGGVTTSFLYDGADVVLDKATNGNEVDYLNGIGLDNKLRQAGAGAPLYFLQDHLGSTTALADANGSVVERTQYTAFGEGAGSALTRYGFTGREHDNVTGLLYYRARWYDPSQGRFISEDPIGMADGLNLYTYVDNSPLNFVDPVGLSLDSFLRGFGNGFKAGVVMGFVIGALIAASGGTVGAIIAAILAVYGGYQLMETIDQLRAMWEDCPDERDELIGELLGGFLGGLLGGAAGIRAGAATRARINARLAARRAKVPHQNGCFVAGTLVQTSEGAQPIEKIEVGDHVLSKNTDTGRVEYKQVTQTFVRDAEAIVEITIQGEVTKPLGATPNHPFYMRRARSNLENGDEDCADEDALWVTAGELRPGDLVQRPSGEWVRVLKVEHKAGTVKVYNFTVADNHTYYVGKLGALAHNDCSPKGDAVIQETLTGKGDFTSKHTLDANDALAAGEKYLGPGYKEIGKPGSGVYRSADGFRQFRMDPNSIQGLHKPNVPHVHFERISPNNVPLSNNHVPITNY